MRSKNIGLVVVGLVLCLAAADVYSAMHARSMAQRLLVEFQQAQASSPASSFAVKDVRMNWGLYSSSGTANLAVAGVKNFEIPVKIDLSQGVAMDGSVLRANMVVMPPADDPALKSFLVSVGDTEPMIALTKFYLNGTRQVNLLFHPAHGVVTRGQRSVSIAWDGATWILRARHANSAEPVIDFQAHSEPIQIKFGEQSISVGAMDASSVQNGWNSNMRSSGSLTLGPVQAGGFAMRQLSYSGAMQARLEDKGANQPNPSGLSSLGIVVTLQNFSAQFDEPQGKVTLDGRVAFQGVPDVQNQPVEARQAATLQWLQKGDVDLHLALSQDLFNAMPPPLQSALGSLIQRGAFTLNQGTYTSELTFRQGHLAMNGVQMR